MFCSSDDWLLRSDAAATFLTYSGKGREGTGWDEMFPTLMEFSLMLRPAIRHLLLLVTVSSVVLFCFLLLELLPVVKHDINRL